MKRFHDGYLKAPLRKTKLIPLGPEDVKVRVLIPSKIASPTTGKCGLNLDKLRSDYNVSVTMLDCSGPERVLTIIGKPVNANLAFGEVLCKLREYGEPDFEPGCTQGNNASNQEDQSNVDVKILADESQIATIIGRKGFILNNLRQETGSRITVHRNYCPESTDRIVQITGKPSSCSECVRKISEKLKKKPPNGLELPYDPSNYKEHYFVEYGGYGNDIAVDETKGMKGAVMNCPPPQHLPGRFGQTGDGPVINRGTGEGASGFSGGAGRFGSTSKRRQTKRRR